MRENISFKVSAADRRRLRALVADRNIPAKVVWRCKIILASADGLGTMAIMRATGKSKPCVWRWQELFMHDGVDGLVRDKTRPPGTPPLPESVRRKVLAKTAGESPPNATHWSVRTMAKAVGISHTAVQRIWAEAGLKPHLVKKFKVSGDPMFEEKVTDVVGLYMNPPDRALVLCVDEKSQIQARRLHQRGRVGGGDPRLPRLSQRRPQALRVDQICRRDPRQGGPRPRQAPHYQGREDWFMMAS